MAKLAVSGFGYSDLVNGLKEGKYKKILVMTGAGISVSSGIPDFRTPGTGLYDNLKEYNLPRPEALFDINYFINNPKPFYKFSKHENWSQYNPTPTHFFIKMLDDKGVLFYNLTQNIDNLEQKTGVDMSKVVQAHGANRGAHCAKCKIEQDIDKFKEAVQSETILYCKEPGCDGPVKPNVVFFGEALP